MTNPRLPASIRRDVERAIEAALHPKGMSTHDGMAVIGVDRLQYLMRLIDAPDEPALHLVTCSKCSAQMRLPYTDGSRTAVSLEPVDGWYFSTDTDWLCPAHSPDVNQK